MFHLYINIISTILLLILINFFLFIHYKKISKFFIIYDSIKKSKFHKKKGYPIGGVIFFINILLLFIINYFLDFEIFHLKKNNLLFFFLCCFMLFVLGIFDDKYNISHNKKFFFLTLIFYIFFTLDNTAYLSELRFQTISKDLNLNSYSKFITIFFFLLFLNAFNMFDGVNMQAGFYSFLVIIFFIIFI